MTSRLPYFPHDELFGTSPDPDLAADVCEIAAFFSVNGQFLLTDLRNDLEIGGDEYDDIDEHNLEGDASLIAAASTIEKRGELLGTAYPFALDTSGFVLDYKGADSTPEHAYLLCLILSHLKSISPVLDQAGLEPTLSHQAVLRDWFQKLSASALAAEVRGQAWAFGFPRADHSPFLQKLRQIWSVIKDGEVHAVSPIGASTQVKDDDIDVIAARPQRDGDPGFPIAVAQVATGKNWHAKTIRNAADNVFFKFWFCEHPASQITSYHVIPFNVASELMRQKTLLLGHILHRTRFVELMREAEPLLAAKEIEAEGVEVFAELGAWLNDFQSGAASYAAQNVPLT